MQRSTIRQYEQLGKIYARLMVLDRDLSQLEADLICAIVPNHNHRRVMQIMRSLKPEPQESRKVADKLGMHDAAFRAILIALERGGFNLWQGKYVRGGSGRLVVLPEISERSILRSLIRKRDHHRSPVSSVCSNSSQ